jgi:hypothetical protein
MFNRSYHLRAVKQAGGGQKVATALLAATEGGKFHRPASPVPIGVRRLCGKRHFRGPDPRQLKLAFALTEEELFEEFERMFPCPR